MERILGRMPRQLKKKFEELEFTEYVEEGYEALQVEAIQERLPFAGEEIELPKTRKPMVAVLEGLSLHVARRLPQNDKERMHLTVGYGVRRRLVQSQVRLRKICPTRPRVATQTLLCPSRLPRAVWCR